MVNERSVTVIGAGLAGAAVCERLCSRGWRVTLIERHAAPAMEASGNHAGSFHPMLARDASRLARLSQAGVAFAIDYWRTLETAGAVFGWQLHGVLQLARADGKTDPATALAVQGEAGDVVRAVSQKEAAALAGCPVAGGGVFFKRGGWVQPVQLVRAQLARCARVGAEFKTLFGQAVTGVRREGSHWQILGTGGVPLASSACVVVAGGATGEAARWFAQTEWPVDAVHGRLTLLDADTLRAPQVPVHREGYVLPAIDGLVVTGASYERSGAVDGAVSDRANLRRLASVLPNIDYASLRACPGSRSAARAVALDRLPMLGALPDMAALSHALVTRKGVRLRDLPRLPGVYVAGAYASRGLTWAALGAELLASMMEGGTPPLEADLLDAVDPARFAFKALRRRGT